jgi:hypothetical protein
LTRGFQLFKGPVVRYSPAGRSGFGCQNGVEPDQASGQLVSGTNSH